jgi:hypothetical protein
LILGELNSETFVYLSHCSFIYTPPEYTPTTAASRFIDEIANEIHNELNRLPADNNNEKPKLTKLKNLRMIVGGGGKVKPDFIRDGLALVNRPLNNIKQHLKINYASYLYDLLKYKINILSTITFILSDHNEALGKLKLKFIILSTINE